MMLLTEFTYSRVTIRPGFRDLSRFYEVCPGVPTTCAKKPNSPGFFTCREGNETHQLEIRQLESCKRYFLANDYTV